MQCRNQSGLRRPQPASSSHSPALHLHGLDPLCGNQPRPADISKKIDTPQQTLKSAHGGSTAFTWLVKDQWYQAISQKAEGLDPGCKYPPKAE